MRIVLLLLGLALASCSRTEYRPVALCSTLEIANKEPCPEIEKRDFGWRDLN